MSEEKEVQKNEENKLHTKRYWVALGAIIVGIIALFLIFSFKESSKEALFSSIVH